VFAALVLLVVFAAQPPRHAAHQPTHEGVFATVAGDSLHLEAVWAAPGRIRLFVTDRAGRALPAARLRALNARVVDDGHEEPLQPSAHDHDAVEGSMRPDVSVPRTVTIVLTPPGRPDMRVTFTFPSYTGGDAETFTVPPTHIPPTRREILARLAIERREAHALVDGGPHEGAYVVLTRVRDYALALEKYVGSLPPARRTRADTAIRETVRTSWLLHASLDNGLPGQSWLSATMMRDAVDELMAAFGEEAASRRSGA
jgi:hypothetical protein